MCKQWTRAAANHLKLSPDWLILWSRASSKDTFLPQRLVSKSDIFTKLFQVNAEYYRHKIDMELLNMFDDKCCRLWNSKCVTCTAFQLIFCFFGFWNAYYIFWIQHSFMAALQRLMQSAYITHVKSLQSYIILPYPSDIKLYDYLGPWIDDIIPAIYLIGQVDTHLGSKFESMTDPTAWLDWYYIWSDN